LATHVAVAGEGRSVYTLLMIFMSVPDCLHHELRLIMDLLNLQ